MALEGLGYLKASDAKRSGGPPTVQMGGGIVTTTLTKMHGANMNEIQNRCRFLDVWLI
jgi:hypothetical protein